MNYIAAGTMTGINLLPTSRSAILQVSAMPAVNHQQVELASVEVFPGGDGFVLGVVTANREVHRMAFPSWAVRQLMRLLPRLDASLLQAREHDTCDLVAYPVVQWGVPPRGADGEVILSLTSDRQVESVRLIGLDEARALQAALAEAIDASSDQRDLANGRTTVN